MTMTGYGYKCAGGDTFDSIARDLYNDEKYASELMCANPEYCGQIMFTGTETILLPAIYIPDEEEATEEINAPWKKVNSDAD